VRRVDPIQIALELPVSKARDRYSSSHVSAYPPCTTVYDERYSQVSEFARKCEVLRAFLWFVPRELVTARWRSGERGAGTASSIPALSASAGFCAHRLPERALPGSAATLSQMVPVVAFLEMETCHIISAAPCDTRNQGVTRICPDASSVLPRQIEM
jgi:hypothetical protein